MLPLSAFVTRMPMGNCSCIGLTCVMMPTGRRSESPQLLVGQCQGFPPVTRFGVFGYARFGSGICPNFESQPRTNLGACTKPQRKSGLDQTNRLSGWVPKVGSMPPIYFSSGRTVGRHGCCYPGTSMTLNRRQSDPRRSGCRLRRHLFRMHSCSSQSWAPKCQKFVQF